MLDICNIGKIIFDYEHIIHHDYINLFPVVIERTLDIHTVLLDAKVIAAQ